MAAVTALLLYLTFAILGFGWRSWLQYRRTGSTGFRGVSGKPGSSEWFAGAGFVLAIVIGVAAPLLQLAGTLEPIAILPSPAVQIFGATLAVVGIAATVYSQVDMGDSWRIGVDPEEHTALVRSGTFGLVRNPIFSAMLVFGAGMMLVTPNLLAIAGFALLFISIELQVRVVEEPYLADVHGDDYRAYIASVGRFLPGLR